MKRTIILLFIIFRLQVATAQTYNGACAKALAGDTDHALKELALIVGKTYFNYDQLIKDKDLNSLHSDKRWPALLQKIKAARPIDLTPFAMYHDFDLLVSSLKEAHTGLYWYNSHPGFDSICLAQRRQIKQGMTDLDFYRIVAPLVTATNEGHTFTRLGSQTQAYFRFSVKYFPVYLKFLNKQAYIINDAGGYTTKGLILTRINSHTVRKLMQTFMTYEPSDGYNTTGKYRWIEQNGKFSVYYARCFPKTDFFDIETQDPATNQTRVFRHIPALSYDDFIQTYKVLPNALSTLPALLKTDSLSSTAVLTINSFSSKKYKAIGIKFHRFIDSVFEQIRTKSIRHLVIDIRKNGGGTEGYEDYLLAYLINQDYLKYKYVQASAFTYSFYPYTDYKDDHESLDKELKDENYLEKDGRILRKAGVEAHEKPKPNPFMGDIYVLINGLTYSGGAEFASLARNHTNAIFIGEETGGGYYGNTSGTTITLQLPESKLEVGIPILKFVVATPKDDIPFGHGILPDHEVQPNIQQYLAGYDAEMETARELIAKSTQHQTN